MAKNAQGNEQKALVGHLGTHFDVMNHVFPLEYFKRKGIVFDVSKVNGRDICSEDLDLEKVQPDMIVLFYSGYIHQVTYGTKSYFTDHPQLSNELIDVLLEKKISMIGIDFAGVRCGKEHTHMDQYCADHNVFIIENLWNLKELPFEKELVVYTFPMNYADITGLPCRVAAEVI